MLKTPVYRFNIQKQKETTTLAQHMIMHKHTADLGGVNIVDKERRSITRYTIESLRIQEKIPKHNKLQRRH